MQKNYYFIMSLLAIVVGSTNAEASYRCNFIVQNQGLGMDVSEDGSLVSRQIPGTSLMANAMTVPYPGRFTTSYGLRVWINDLVRGGILSRAEVSEGTRSLESSVPSQEITITCWNQ